MSSTGTPNSNSSGILGFLNGIAAPTTYSSSTQYPIWLQSAIEGLAGAAGNLAQQPYQQFPGPQVAAPSGATRQAWQLAQSNVGNYQPALSAATSATNAEAAPITPGQIQGFLNPEQDYITGALNRNLTQNVLPGIQDKFVSAGQSRSPQESEMTSRALLDNQTAVGQSLAGGYQGALNSLLQSRQQQGAAGAQLGTLAGLTSQLGATDVGSLASAGSAQDQNAQQNINAAMSNFQNQQQWPYQQLGFLSDIINRVPIQATGPTSTAIASGQTYAPSPLATYAGTLAGGNSIGHARGGRVIPFPRRPIVVGALSRAA